MLASLAHNVGRFTGTFFVLVTLATISPDRAGAADGIFASSPPERCTGYGDLQSISLTDWEAGLGSWTAGTRNVTSPGTFETPDWAATDALPDGKAGWAAFVPNLDVGDCAADDQTGVLTLTSPQIVIPGDVIVPRISIDHWFDIFDEYDGGNLRISVNGGSYQLIPASAIEMAPYEDTLAPALDTSEEPPVPDNTNPLAGQDAFTGTYNDKPTGSWVQSRINLLGIVDPGDSIRLRFDFGIDGCVGAIGWYVDDVEFYHCPYEPLPSDCGNGVIDGGEACDDGNNFIGDGCSHICQVESGWQCDAPTSPATVPDSSFEAGTPNPYWTEVSNNPIGTPICSVPVCGKAGGTGPAEGTYWVNLGSVPYPQEGSVSQSFVIPSTVSKLSFELEIPSCDSPADYFEILIDGNQVLLVDGSSPLCGVTGYSTQTVDISAYADDGVHDLEIHSITVSANGGVSSFFIDVLGLPGKPSVCTRIGTHLTLIKDVINDDGGTALTSDWTLAWSGPSNLSGPGPILSSAVTAGTYNLAESGGPPGYAASDWACTGGTQVDSDTVTVGVDQDVTCRISNNDIAPTLTVFKTIINDHGGPITDPDAFNLEIDGITVQHDSPTLVDVGDHTVTEDTLPGYLPGTWGGDCTPGGAITLELGQNATCSITNDDIGLTLIKQVVNNNGGNAAPGQWTLSASGPVPFSGSGPTVSSPAPFVAGAYVLSQSAGPSGYATGGWNCVGGGSLVGNTITLASGQSATCTTISDDISPTLTVVKNIDNGDGGTITDPNAFGLKVDGQPVQSGVAVNVNAGSHTVSEAGHPAYVPGPWGGNCNSLGNVTLTLAQNATCTITNNDIPSADLGISKTDGKTSVAQGSSTTYTILVSNAGPSTVSDAHVTDNFGASLSCTYTSVAAGGASGNTAAGSGNISNTLVMPAGSSVTYTALCTIAPGATGTLSNTATVNSAVADPNPGNESATDTTSLTASADLSISKTDGQTSATPGSFTYYSITVRNHGPSNVGEAYVTDSFPANLNCTYTSFATGGASGNAASGSGDIADTLTLPAGSAVFYSATCRIDPSASGMLSNTANVSSVVPDPNPGNESATDTTNLVASADLLISKTDGQTSRAPGSFTYYSITVGNNGPSNVDEANVTDSFPANLNCTYTSLATGGASGNTASGSGDIADTLALPASSSVFYSATCRIDPSASGTLSNTANVSSEVPDPNPGNESATDTTNLVASANLVVTKTDGQTTAAPGGNTTYTIVVSNAGPSNVNSASMTDVFSADLSCTYTSVAAGGASGNTAAGSGNIADTLALPAGSSVTYTVPCTIAAEATGTLSNTATVSSAVTDPSPGNQSATDFTNLTALADLSISKTDGQTSATPGNTTTYTIVASNAGPSSVSDATVSDIFSAGLGCTYTSVAAGGASGNTAGSGNIGDTLVMPAGSSVTYSAICAINPGATGTLSNTAGVSSVVTDPNPGNESATDFTNLTSAADLSISKTDNRTSAAPGGSTTYTIVVNNAGPSTVSDAGVTDNFAADLSCTYTSVAAGGASGNKASGSGNIADTLVLPASSSVTYSALCSIDPGAVGTLSNTASVSSVVADPNPGNESATDFTNLTSAADLSISKTDNRTSAAPGGSTTYTIVVNNAGPSTVSDAGVTDNFAADLSCTYTSVAAGGASGNTASGSGNIGDTLVMPAGGSVTYSALCSIDPGAAGTLSNTASVSSVVADPNPGNESATDFTNLTASADLAVTKSDGQTSATPGGSTTYTIVVSNAGPSTVSDAGVTDNFAADLSCTYTSVAAGGASGNTASGSGDIADTLMLPPGSAVTYSALCSIDPGATGTLSNTASVSSAVTDPNPGDESATDTTNLTASANLSISKTDGQTSATPGGSTTYTIVVSNAGPSTVSDASVTDDFAADLSCTYASEATGGASGNTASGSGDIADTLMLPPGSAVTYTAPCDIDAVATGTLSNTASVSSAVTDPNPGDESATDTTNLTASADLSISKTDGRTAATPGRATTYAIVVSNAGPSTVSDASVTDSFAADLSCTYTSVATGGASGNTASGGDNIDDVLLLPPDSSVTYTVPCDIDAAATGTLSNTATVNSEVTDPNPGNESATDTTNLTATANLSISKTDGQSSATPGGDTTYTILVSNAGPSTVSDASVTDAFAADLSCTYTSEATGGASGNTVSGNGDIADTLMLPPGSAVTYTAPCDINPEATGALSNTASVSSDIVDPNPGDESAMDTTNLTASADLSISKTDGQTSATPGGNTTYTIVVSNAGPSMVSDAKVTDSFVADLTCTYSSVATGGASGHTVSGSGNIADILVLPAGSSVTYTVPCDIDAAATGTLSNTATVSSKVTDPNPGNESATDNNSFIGDRIFSNGFES